MIWVSGYCIALKCYVEGNAALFSVDLLVVNHPWNESWNAHCQSWDQNWSSTFASSYNDPSQNITESGSIWASSLFRWALLQIWHPPRKCTNMSRKGKQAGLLLWKGIHSVFLKYCDPPHQGGKSILKLYITTSKWELEKQMCLGLVSALPGRIKGCGFPETVPAISHMYIV